MSESQIIISILCLVIVSMVIVVVGLRYKAQKEANQKKRAEESKKIEHIIQRDKEKEKQKSVKKEFVSASEFDSRYKHSRSSSTSRHNIDNDVSVSDYAVMGYAAGLFDSDDNDRKRCGSSGSYSRYDSDSNSNHHSDSRSDNNYSGDSGGGDSGGGGGD